MKKIFILLTFLLPLVGFAQITDDFESGDITNWTQSPDLRWEASTDNPINGVYSLHHTYNETVTENYHNQLSTPFGAFDITSQTTTWRFQLRYEYNPSGDNTWSVFLFADADANEMYPGGNVNGYAFGVNFSGTSDLVQLWDVSTGSASAVINTDYNWQDNIGTATSAGFEIKRTATGDWSIFIDDDGGFDNLVQIGTTENSITHTTTTNFGICYEYTASADQKLWFDDIYVGEEILDVEAPTITGITVLSNNTILVDFNENLSQVTAENVSNYSVDGGIGNPTSAILTDRQVELIFSGTFTDEQLYFLTVNGVEDIAGNATVNEESVFSYFQIAAISVSSISSTEVDIVFNKKVEPITAENVSNYLIDNSIGNPSVAVIDAIDSTIVHLTLSSSLVLEQNYIVTVTGVKDNYGNTISPVDLEFFYFEPQPYSIVINEIMCDVNPVPEVLPAHEYIEIYNNTNYDISLTNWTLIIGDNSPKVFPSVIIEAHGYAIICEDIAEDDLSIFGITIPILNPSELTVTGKRLVLKDANGVTIEDLIYSNTWYNDTEKDNGGWSLERIDYENYCGEEENWSVTMDYTGGTPGRVNSIYAINPDNSSPEIASLAVLSSKQLQLQFSENVSALSSLVLSNYAVNSSINPISVFPDAEDNSIINLVFENNFDIGTNTILINNIEDNCGNVMLEYSDEFEYLLIYPKSVEVMSNNQLRIHFSENVDVTTAQEILNYTVNGSINTPYIALISATDTTSVNLQFTEEFVLGEYYTISIENIQDVNANIMLVASLDFAYYSANPNDIVFNEIMCDVNPAPIGLPEVQYVELYNSSDYDIDLTNWIFAAESQSERELPYVNIKSHEYIILCQSGYAAELSQYGTVIDILGSTDLTSSGKNIKLLKPDRTIIADVTYTDTWYDDTEKDNGGWALEIIDSNNFCSEDNNWAASVDQSGGTPGTINSINAINSDNTSPELLTVTVSSSNTLTLVFDKNITFETGNDTLNYSVSNLVANPMSANVDSVDRKTIILKFAENFTDNQIYTISISNLQDYCGNQIENTQIDYTYYLIYPIDLWVKDDKRIKIQFSEAVEVVSGTNVLNYVANNGLGSPETVIRETSNPSIVHIQFAGNFVDGEEVTLSLSNISDINENLIVPVELKFTYYLPKENDIIINEVLFNPFTGGADFVEVYNNSENIIDLSNFQLANRDENGAINTTVILSENNFNIAPGEFFVFTTSKESVIQSYMSDNEEGIIEIDALPSYSDDKGTVVLLYNNTTVIDEFSYTEDMHLRLLDSEDGVSLERVNYNVASNDESNWHSAAETVGFATPAYKNSQYNENIAISDDEITISPEIFSPDNDGFEDYCYINYKFETNGNIANVYIFDANGRIIKRLCNNKLLSIEGTLVWDGLKDDNTKARTGIYLVYFETFDIDGNIKSVKKTTVLATKF